MAVTSPRSAGAALEALQFVLSSRGEHYLEWLAAESITDENHLSLATHLRKELSQEETHAVLETALLRQRAVPKFSRAAAMYFTRSALEQASSEVISHYRTLRIAGAGVRLVADLGCGIGGDALALAQQCVVVGIERDILRLTMARENVRVYGLAGSFYPVLADLLEFPALPVDAFFADPARRDNQGKRYFVPDDYAPPLGPLLSRWQLAVPHGAVKVSPGIDYDFIPADASVEFISLDREVKEGVLWFGDLRDGARRRATLLPAGNTISDLDDSGAPVPVSSPAQFLYEPDGAVIRAHLIETLAQRLGANKIDDDIAYLTSETAIATPFARCFTIEESMPFHLKKLRARVRELNVGRLTIKKRGSPLSPEALLRRLDVRGDRDREAILFLTHVQGEPYVLIGRELDLAAPGR